MQARHSIISFGVLCSALGLARPGFAQERVQAYEPSGACRLAEDGWHALHDAQAYAPIIPPGDLWFCFGWDDSLHQCLLYAATEEICARLEPCWLPLAIQPPAHP